MPRVFMTILIGLGLSWLAFSLGQWQTGRADEKMQTLEKQRQALEAAPITPQTPDLNTADHEFRRLELQGRWVDESVVYIDNRQVNGIPAVQVIQAFKVENLNFVVPIDRGLLLRDPREPRRAPDFPARAQLNNEAPPVETISATILPRFARSAELRGLGIDSQENVLKTESNGYRVWSNFQLKDYGEVINRPVSSFVATLQPVQFEKGQDNQTQMQNGFYLNAVKLP
ncbi:MAG: SURF1 family protein, partial [Limnobacter sp.]|nr:SURF1 family protein [Limnobacter sp.]